jgi:L-amino acid N-acyltransferase YncA
MSSAYGNIPRLNNANLQAINQMLPSTCTLKSGETVSLVRVDVQDEKTIATIHKLLNDEILDGRTYPQEDLMDLQQFKRYFLSNDAFVLLSSNREVVGTFYVKPNFPGRCSHVCNGGFITHPDWRGKGAGSLLCDYFIKIAPLLGYRQSMFNLVFANNAASVATWRARGFQELGRVPQAGRLKKYNDEGECTGEEYIDAIMFGYSFM